MYTTFKETFKKIRESKRYNQNYIADKIGVSQSYISQIESGSRKPTIEFLSKIKELGFDIVINIEEEKELLLNSINKLEPFDIQKVTIYAQKLAGNI
jgi:transcriptional regulator with XRE-family HTH domain